MLDIYRNMKQTIKLRESELKRMIAESVKRALNESVDDEEIQNDVLALKEKVINAYNKAYTEYDRLSYQDMINILTKLETKCKFLVANADYFRKRQAVNAEEHSYADVLR